MAQTSKKKAPPKKVASKKKEVRSEAKENKKEEIIPSQRIINQTGQSLPQLTYHQGTEGYKPEELAA